MTEFFRLDLIEWLRANDANANARAEAQSRHTALPKCAEVAEYLRTLR